MLDWKDTDCGDCTIWNHVAACDHWCWTPRLFERLRLGSKQPLNDMFGCDNIVFRKMNNCSNLSRDKIRSKYDQIPAVTSWLNWWPTPITKAGASPVCIVWLRWSPMSDGWMKQEQFPQEEADQTWRPSDWWKNRSNCYRLAEVITKCQMSERQRNGSDCYRLIEFLAKW